MKCFKCKEGIVEEDNIDHTMGVCDMCGQIYIEDRSLE